MPKEMLDPEKQSGAFVPIAKQIAEDAGKLTDDEENWTEYAGKLDQMSLKAYLEQFRGKTDDWRSICSTWATTSNSGSRRKTSPVSIWWDFIGTDLNEPYEMFGESDEVFRIKDGSTTLIKALLAAPQNKIEMRLGQSLAELGVKDDRIVAGFDTQGSTSSETFDAVILALPFTRLRQVKGLESLELGEEKLKTIRELGYGTNAKVLAGTTSRVWRTDASGLPAPSNGTFFTDLGFQNWESSRAQPGDAGLLTNYLGGKAGQADPRAAIDAFRAGLPKMSPKMAESLDPAAVRVWFWATYPYALGSYASAKPGQYTTMLDVAGEPALDGRLQFAGEHTSSDFLGYMNGGVVSGNRAAAALIEAMAPKE